jgi:hypothetical protein
VAGPLRNSLAHLQSRVSNWRDKLARFDRRCSKCRNRCQSLTNAAVIEKVLYKAMSREKPPLRAGCRIFLLRHSAQLVEGALSIREWPSSGQASWFVFGTSRRETFFPWFHFTVETAPNKPNGCRLEEWRCMVLFETRGLWLSSIV